MVNYYSTGIEIMYEGLDYYKKRPLLTDEVFKGVYTLTPFWWDKQISGKYVFNRHQAYLKQVSNMFKFR